MKKVSTFFGQYRFLSNFYPAEFVWDGIVWPTSEHAYQAAKTTNRKARIVISKLTDPADTKHLGAAVRCRDDWDQVKVSVMYDIVKAKFSQNPTLKAKLIETGDAVLEEGNTWKDTFWGICPPDSNIGDNNLGKVLMRIRAELITLEIVSND